MKSQLNILLGGLGLFALQGCKTPQAEQAQQPNVIYVFRDQFRNQAMEVWGQEGFREKVNFRNDPVHTPRLNDFARESLVPIKLILLSMRFIWRYVRIFQPCPRLQCIIH